ncbi:MAG: ZIP family metal transporter [Candidatus Bathyarchaeia archaeon]
MVLHLTFGFTIFFLLERFIYWYHGHMHGYDSDVDDRMRTKRFVYLNLIGDAIHNLIDGMIITVGFFISISFGIAVTVAVMFHELPQERGLAGLRRLHQDLGIDI